MIAECGPKNEMYSVYIEIAITAPQISMNVSASVTSMLNSVELNSIAPTVQAFSHIHSHQTF